MCRRVGGGAEGMRRAQHNQGQAGLPPQVKTRPPALTLGDAAGALAGLLALVAEHGVVHQGLGGARRGGGGGGRGVGTDQQRWVGAGGCGAQGRVGVKGLLGQWAG